MALLLQHWGLTQLKREAGLIWVWALICSSVCPTVIKCATQADLLWANTQSHSRGNWLLVCTVSSRLKAVSTHTTLGVTPEVRGQTECKQGGNHRRLIVAMCQNHWVITQSHKRSHCRAYLRFELFFTQPVAHWKQEVVTANSALLIFPNKGFPRLWLGNS